MKRTQRDRLIQFMVFIKETTGVGEFTITDVITILEYLGFIKVGKKPVVEVTP